MNILSILHWNMSPTGAAPNRSHLYQYWPNGHANVVRYDNFSSNFKLWYPELASIIDIYFTLLSLGIMSFNMGHLSTDLINAWVNLAGSKHNLTSYHLLWVLTQSYYITPSSVIMSNFCSWSSLSLNGFCSTYATHPGGTR